MIYPEFIKKNDTIGVSAPSDGITKKEKLYRLDSAIKYFSSLGYRIEETKNVRTSLKGRSSSSKVRNKQLKSLFENTEVKAIIYKAILNLNIFNVNTTNSSLSYYFTTYFPSNQGC